MLFESLYTAGLRVVDEAAYLLGLRFHERPYIPGWRKLLKVKPGGSDEAVALATRVIEDIEEAAGNAFEVLTRQEVGPYQRCIYGIVDRRRRQEHPLSPEDSERAKQMLDALHRKYGEGYVHALV